MRPASLSVPSSFTYTSTSSRSAQSPRPSPRRGLLMTAPPISPGLPSPCPRCRRAKSMPRAYKLSMAYRIQLFVLIFGSISALLILFKSYSEYERRTSPAYDMVDALHLPNRPSAVLGEFNGKIGWTIWIPPSSSFPLRPWQYEELCTQVTDVVKDSRQKKAIFANEPKFVDVDEAFRSELPQINKQNQAMSANTCKSSLTYVMETEDAGMGNTLLSLWLAYGMAQKEGRAFFVDDTRWAYGNYTSYFKPPPDPGCQPAPSNHRIPCPQSASHLVISAATISHSLLQDLEGKSSNSQHRQRKIFKLMRSGYEALFHLADKGDAAYLQRRIKGHVFGEAKTGGITVGLHIRHGDVHPREKVFEGDYLPLMRYMDEARDLLASQYAAENASPGSVFETYSTYFSPLITIKSDLKRDLSTDMGPSRLFVASDDPSVFSSSELSSTMRAQDRFSLATKADLEKMLQKTKSHSPLDSLHGWDGGFFRSVFLSLGQQDRRTISPPKHAVLSGSNLESEEHRRIAQASLHTATSAGFASGQPWRASASLEPSTKDALSIRTLIGRGYLLDLAVLGQCDAIICGVNSAACRVLGVMAGWEKVTNGMWRNVDGHEGWIGISSGKKW